MQRAWAGVGIGKGHHHAVVIDPDGVRLLSRRVINDETALLELVGQVTGLALAATGGDMTVFASADHLAGYAGLAPAPRDSGRISGNLHRYRRYQCGLQRALYTSALVSIRCSDQSRTFCDRKRSEGKRHTQAVLALARRRVNVLWPLLRDHRCYASIPRPIAAAASLSHLDNFIQNRRSASRAAPAAVSARPERPPHPAR